MTAMYMYKGLYMNWTNLCSCALIKDHKMRQIINDPTILKNNEFGIIFLKTNYFALFFKNLRLSLRPPPPPPPRPRPRPRPRPPPPPVTSADNMQFLILHRHKVKFLITIKLTHQPHRSNRRIWLSTSLCTI